MFLLGNGRSDTVVAGMVESLAIRLGMRVIEPSEMECVRLV